jgi:hypothetical protein
MRFEIVAFDNKASPQETLTVLQQLPCRMRGARRSSSTGVEPAGTSTTSATWHGFCAPVERGTASPA